MPGIAAYGAYVPRYRLGAATAGWNSSVERAVANFDEDSVTMSVAAGADCLQGLDRNQVDGLIFATTTPPYLEKQNAAIIAAALDLRREIFTADVTGVLKSGTAALKSALDAVAAGSARQVLVVAADMRQGPPRSDLERSSGDGAAALLVARDGVIADFAGSHSITENLLDNWRASGEGFVRSWEDRFATEEGLERVVPEAVSAFLSQRSLSQKDVRRVALYAPDRRRHDSLARRLGFAPPQMVEPLFGRLGCTGAAFPLMLLVRALEQAAAGELLLAVSYGDGCDVLAFRTTPGIKAAAAEQRGGTGYLDAKVVLDSYETYARWREVWLTDSASRRPSPPAPSVAALWRETDKNLRLYGGRCSRCGYLQYPQQRICVNCQASDSAAPVRLSDQPATLFTYSMDYIAGAVDTPLVVAVVDFAVGGRMLCMMTDRELREVRIGMPVEMSFRRLRVVNGIHNYYWKAAPQRLAGKRPAVRAVAS
ncbi:MAG: hydroxymethylglutaryl-CoA synthase family protein [SAR202 cluster bacterium]|nr:hydroxymethylglutaryl-CoA synthase family protein [SAR202 cluster bacterium]